MKGLGIHARYRTSGEKTPKSPPAIDEIEIGNYRQIEVD